MELPYVEEIMIVGRTVWTQSTSVTDRQTDGRTDGRTELLSQRPCNAERRTVKMECPSQTLPLAPKENRGVETWRMSVFIPSQNQAKYLFMW